MRARVVPIFLDSVSKHGMADILGIVPIHSVHTGCRMTQGIGISDFAPIPEVMRGVPYVPIRQIHAGCRMTIGRNRDGFRASDL